jgi:hypothetical protein
LLLIAGMLAQFGLRRISGRATEGAMDNQDRRNFLVFGAAVALILFGWFVISALQRQQKIDDCLLSRRANCEAYVDGK